MIQRLRVSVIVALFLLASATTANAGCAWVLWGRVEMRYPVGIVSDNPIGDVLLKNWQPHSGYESEAKCQRTAKSESKSVLIGLAGSHGVPYAAVGTDKMAGMGANLGEFFKPEDLLYQYKHMECEVPDGTAIVSVNKYRNHNKKSHAEGGTQELWPLRLSLLGVAPDTIKRTGGNKLWADCFLGKGSPWAIARVLECFVAYSDKWIARFKNAGGGTPERKIANWLADDDLSWEAALQNISDGWFGLDCNGFTGNWFKVNCPDFKLTPDDRANEVRQKQGKVYRKSLGEIEYWDVMCYTANEHIALVNNRVDANGHFMVAQSAGGGPRMNEFAFIQTGPKTFKLAAPTKSDIGYDFYVVSLW